MSDKRGNRRKNIVIACGGTAGHIFPGLTLAEELLKRHSGDVKISFITSENTLARRLLEKSGHAFYTLPVKGIKKRSFLGNVDFVASFLTGAMKSAGIVFKERPDCFVAFGSYVSGLPFAAASLLKVPTLIHEQNTTMGRANRIMRRFATKIALSFPRSEGGWKDNIVITGNPIRKSAAKVSTREKAIDMLELSRDKFTMLVIGGSQGARAINSAVIGMFAGMDELLRRRIQVVHIAGDADYERVKEEYRKIGGISYRIYRFFGEMGIAYSAADIAIGRAGASVLFELCAHRIPSILIPYPFAEGHQLENAKYLAERNAAILMEEKRLSGESLKSAVLRLLEDNIGRDLIKRRLAGLSTPEAARRLADEVISLAGL